MNSRTLMSVAIAGTFVGSSLAVASSVSGGVAAAASTGAGRSVALASAVRRTIAASSFTMRSPGQVLTYEAPDRTSVESQGSTVVTIGGVSYLRLPAGTPWRWTRLSAIAPSSGGSANALVFLNHADGLRVTSVHGSIYSASLEVTGPPTWLQDLIYPGITVPCHSSSNTACTDLGPTYFVSAKRYRVTVRVTVEGGYVVRETFVLHGFTGPSGTHRHNTTGTVSYSHVNASPPVETPVSVAG